MWTLLKRRTCGPKEFHSKPNPLLCQNWTLLSKATGQHNQAQKSWTVMNAIFTSSSNSASSGGNAAMIVFWLSKNQHNDHQLPSEHQIDLSLIWTYQTSLNCQGACNQLIKSRLFTWVIWRWGAEWVAITQGFLWTKKVPIWYCCR